MNKKILGLSGSYRHGSYSMSVLQTFQSRCPMGVDFIIADTSHFPLYNQDLESPEPQFLIDFKKQIAAVDAMLIVTPEHNRSVPVVLKNALDRASRPQYKHYDERPMSGIPTAVAGISPYNLGAFGAVHHLRQILAFLNTPVMGQPEFYLTQVADKIGENGLIIEQNTLDHIDKFLQAFILFMDHFPQAHKQ